MTIQQVTTTQKKKLLMIVHSQFGYHIDAYYYCKYLKNDFDITCLTFDYGRPKIAMEGIRVTYVTRPEHIGILRKNMRFLFRAFREIRKGAYHIHFIKYFRGCSLLKILLPLKIFVFDIRSGTIRKNTIQRSIYDSILKIESMFFRHITVISKGLANKLAFPNAYILPLGADIISSNNKHFAAINLLYVGTLSNRHLDRTIIGFANFYKDFHQTISMQYTIVGDGSNNEEDNFKRLVDKLGLGEVVHIVGRVPHNKLKEYFDNHNIGVSFVPITAYFDHQPVTKTFEYLLSGMVVIATATQENKKVITKSNGILINDTHADFYNSLKLLVEERKRFDSAIIRQDAFSKYSWKKIVDDLAIYLQNLVRSKVSI